MDTSNAFPSGLTQEKHDFAGQYAALEHITGEGTLLRIKGDTSSVLIRRADHIIRLYADDIVGMVSMLTETPPEDKLFYRLPEFDLPPPPTFHVTVSGPGNTDLDLDTDICVQVNYTILRDGTDVTKVIQKTIIVQSSNSADGDDWVTLSDEHYLSGPWHTTIFFNELDKNVQRLRAGILLAGSTTIVFCEHMTLIRPFSDFAAEMTEAGPTFTTDLTPPAPPKIGKYVRVEYKDDREDTVIDDVIELRNDGGFFILVRYGKSDVAYIPRDEVRLLTHRLY